MNLNSILAFQDNYIWVLNDPHGKCIIVDPGTASPVFKAIEAHHWSPEAILLTHHHADHVGGVKQLKEKYPDLEIYGPKETESKGATHIITGGDKIHVLGLEFSVMATPGHTAGHLCYYSNPYLFCGDTLFSGGCGRVFEGTMDEMYESIQLINRLPPETLICCAHEYTESNLKFSLSILPNDEKIKQYYIKVKELRSKKHSTLPSLLQIERQINIFLRTQHHELKEKIKKRNKLATTS